MKRQAVPGLELSYRLRCVAVESERVYGDVVVTRRSSGAELAASPAARGQNLKRQSFQGPDFLELNRPRRPGRIRRYSLGNQPAYSRRLTTFARSKSMDDGVAVIPAQPVQTPTPRRKEYPRPRVKSTLDGAIVVSTLVDRLLIDIYSSACAAAERSGSESAYSWRSQKQLRPHVQRARLQLKGTGELRVLLRSLREHVSHTGGLLVRQLRRRDYLHARRERLYDVITAHLQAHSSKRTEDTRMRFSLTPQPGESGFIQWLDAMKMVAKLQGGIPVEFRKKLWLTLSERHLDQRGVDWKQAEKLCFNEWSNPDDEELGIQIVKDLHRTGCSLFCGAAGRDNQAVLRRVLLGYARWNKSVGYCQGLNVLAALILQVVDRDEAAAVKVMIYLIEGVLPEGYFADNLRGLSIDMAVFRDLLRMRLPRLSRHLESLQNDMKDKATGSSYEPPLTNVFTMQWFLTLFCHCLPQDAVLRVWDLIFLEGDDVLLRTALAIWEGLSDRIMTVTSADEFYSIMGVLTREMLEFTDTNHLIKTIVGMGRLHGVTSLREKHRYNITPWARRLSDDEDSDTEDDERLAVAAAAAIFAVPRLRKTDRGSSSVSSLQTVNPSSDRERLALDISTLKQQYAKLRERQRQAHIILSAACARQSMGPSTASQAMNHLLVGKSALVSNKNRPTIRPGPGSLAARAKTASLMLSPRVQTRKERQQQQQDVTIHWKDMKKRKDETAQPAAAAAEAAEETSGGGGGDGGGAPSLGSAEGMSTALRRPVEAGAGGGAATAASVGPADSDSDSTSTELCDDPDRLSDLDSEELTSASDPCPPDPAILAHDDELASPAASANNEQQQQQTTTSERSSEHLEVYKEETSIAQLTDQIRRLSAEDAEFKSSFDDPQLLNEKTSSEASRFITEDKVLISEANREKALANVSTTFNSASPVSDYLKTFEAQGKTDNGVAAKCETFDFHYDSSNPRDRIHLTERLASDARSDVSGEAKTNEINKVVLDAVRLDDTYFTRSSYVIGHLPIAPMNYEIRRPDKVSPEALAPRDEASVHRSRLKQSTYDSSADALINTSETKYNNYKIDLKQSPKTPESFKSFDSGETMGPDSITSSLAVSPKTPLRSSSRDFILADKSVGSSVSSDSKTLTMRSVESEAVAPKRQVETPGDKSITPSTDSLAQPKSVEPPCSSTESFCSPTKAKSEKSFSSDLQSPVSANSIKFTSGYNYKNDGIELHKDPTEIGAITSPFYPISNPNKKTPSPYNEDKSKTNRDNMGSNEFRGISQDIVVNNYLETKTYAQAFDVESKMSTQAFEVPQLKTTDESSTGVVVDDETFKSLPKNLYNYDYEDVTSTKDNIFSGKDMGRTSAFEPYRKTKFEEELQETDTLSPLPRNLFNEHRNDIFERTRGRSLDGKLETLEITGMSYERSNSTIEKRFPEMLLSPSMEDFANSVKKRSSDVLEDLRHLESKSTEDGEIDPNMLTRKTSFIWEDLKSLEARRQDTFSDSVQGFSRQRIEVPGISISTEGRKTYVVEPKINIENSDSILKVVTYKNSNGSNHDEEDDGDDSKLGVWTKVKPRKRNDNGRRSSDRALKIIQENSAILQKILTCQARKRLPDLEEISKEITISPINEEISKIFSPILEKMGLNEHEINEELARINFKELDRNTTTTTASEFEAKINDELSKLSLIGDNEEVAYLPDVDDLTSDYLVAREAFIDRQINEELSKLLVNYSEDSPMSLQKNSSSLDASDDLSGRTAKSYSYKSSDDSLEIKNDLGLKDPMHGMIFKGTSHAYVPRNNYPKPRDLSAKSDVDIYRELEKLDHISYAQALPSVTAELPQDMAPPTKSYVNEMIKSPKREYPTSVIDKQPTYDISPLKSPYDSPYSSSAALQSSYDYKSRISPRKVPSNPYSVRSHDTKNPLETGFENTTFELTSRKTTTAPASLNYDLSKEHLEFRVKYDLDDDYSMNNKSKAQDIDLKLSPFQTDIAELDKDASYFSSKKALTPTNKYSSNKDDNASLASTFETSSYESAYRRKYNNVSPVDKYSAFSDNYEAALHQPYKVSSLNTDAEVSSYLSGSPASIAKRHRDARVLSPHYQYDYSKPLSSSYATVSPSFDTSLSLTTRGKTTYSDVSPTNTLSFRKSTLAVSNAGENKDTRYDFDKSPSPKSMGFSPFPVRNLPRKPKEVAVKLGLYSPTNSTSSK